MSDLTALLDTRDYATPGCPNEADRDDGLCRYCRTNPPGRQLPPTELRRLFNDPKETRMAGYTGNACKVTGCQAAPISRHGIYAGLCDTHRKQREDRRRAVRQASLGRAAAQQAAAAAAAPTAAGNGHTRPGSLQKLAAHADRTRYELDQAREAHTAALQALRAALDEQAA